MMDRFRQRAGLLLTMMAQPEDADDSNDVSTTNHLVDDVPH